MSESVLIVDDESSILKAMEIVLGDKYRVTAAKNGQDAITIYKKEKPDLILLDIGLPDLNGLEVFNHIKKNDPDATAIMVTAVDDIKTVVDAIKTGVYDYMVKPIDSQSLLVTVQNALENKRLKDQIRAIQNPMIDRYKLELIGKNPKIEAMIDIARKVSKSTDTPVFIQGESGSGKGVLARAIHYSAGEKAGPFVTVNCGAIAKDLVESELFGYEGGAFTGARVEGKKGRFEEAAGGTLFLDEIGVMSLSAQAKLLHVLEDRIFYRVGGTKAISLSARVISATNNDLEKAVKEGAFRSDLFYRLNVVTLDVPPLRERVDDIILLAKYFLGKYNIKFGKTFSGISPEAEKIFCRYPWAGNVRELRNTIERIVLLEEDDVIQPHHLPFARVTENTKQQKTEFDLAGLDILHQNKARDIINNALKMANGNVVEAAKFLNMPVHSLRYRIKKLKSGYDKYCPH